MKHDEMTIIKRSFNWTNLKVIVSGKMINGITGAIEGIAMELAEAVIVKCDSGRSMIVYCSTKREVDDISSIIRQHLMHKQHQQQQLTASTTLIGPQNLS